VKEWKFVDARQHHVQMKYVLAQLAIRDPARFFASFGPGGDAAYLSNLWAALGQSLPTEQQVSSDGAAVWHQKLGEGVELLVLTLPPPAARNEAYFVGAVRFSERGCRVFCLEQAIMPSTGEEFTMLSELAANGRSNWGPGTEPVVEEFAKLLCEVVLNESARPVSFMPMTIA
jgi:hypothetical protein